MNLDRSVSRRDVLRSLGVGGLALAGTTLLSACRGASGPSNTGNPNAQPTGTSDTAAVRRIADLIGPIDATHAARGVPYSMGATLTFSGTGAYYGEEGQRGIYLASRHIATLGGPRLRTTYKDIPLETPAKGVDAMRQFGAAKIPVMMTANVDDVGAEFAGSKQYEILSIGGVTGLFGNGMPFFWGTQANLPNDPYPGMLKYVRAKMRDVKTVAFLGPDLGTGNKPVIADFEAKVKGAGLTPSSIVVSKLGSTTYATPLQQLKSDRPDIIFVSEYGNDVGYFMKQYVTSGINAPVIGADLLPPAEDIAGTALDGYMFSYDYFDAKHPPNAWSEIFVDDYQNVYGQPPSSVAADYYENTFVVWELIRRVSAKRGDIRSGAQLQRELEADPNFKSVHGGNGSTVGTLSFDLETHSPRKRAMGLYRFDKGKVTPLAYYDIGGADFRLA